MSICGRGLRLERIQGMITQSALRTRKKNVRSLPTSDFRLPPTAAHFAVAFRTAADCANIRSSRLVTYMRSLRRRQAAATKHAGPALRRLYRAIDRSPIGPPKLCDGVRTTVPPRLSPELWACHLARRWFAWGMSLFGRHCATLGRILPGAGVQRSLIDLRQATIGRWKEPYRGAYVSAAA